MNGFGWKLFANVASNLLKVESSKIEIIASQHLVNRSTTNLLTVLQSEPNNRGEAFVHA